MDITIDINPADLSPRELLACVEYAKGQPWIKEDKALFENKTIKGLIEEIEEYFLNTEDPVPDVIAKFLWVMSGSSVWLKE